MKCHIFVAIKLSMGIASVFHSILNTTRLSRSYILEEVRVALRCLEAWTVVYLHRTSDDHEQDNKFNKETQRNAEVIYPDAEM